MARHRAAHCVALQCHFPQESSQYGLVRPTFHDLRVPNCELDSLWDVWRGCQRMESILEQRVNTLREADALPSTEEREQYSILDAVRLLSHNGSGERC